MIGKKEAEIMDDNLILREAKKYTPQNRDIRPVGYEYNTKKGYTASVLDGAPFITSVNAHHLNTKKEDVETGEDQKGE